MELPDRRRFCRDPPLPAPCSYLDAVHRPDPADRQRYRRTRLPGQPRDPRNHGRRSECAHRPRNPERIHQPDRPRRNGGATGQPRRRHAHRFAGGTHELPRFHAHGARQLGGPDLDLRRLRRRRFLHAAPLPQPRRGADLQRPIRGRLHGAEHRTRHGRHARQLHLFRRRAQTAAQRRSARLRHGLRPAHARLVPGGAGIRRADQDASLCLLHQPEGRHDHRQPRQQRRRRRRRRHSSGNPRPVAGPAEGDGGQPRRAGQPGRADHRRRKPGAGDPVGGRARRPAGAAPPGRSRHPGARPHRRTAADARRCRRRPRPR